MKLKWRLPAVFLGMASLALLLFWVGESAQIGSKGIVVDPGVVLVALFFPTMLVYLYSQRLSWKLENLHLTVKRLSQGNFERPDYWDTDDELGQLATELGRLARRMEEMISASTQETLKMEAILKGMQEGVVALDLFGRIVLVNLAAEKIFSRPESEVKLKYLIELVRNFELDVLVTGVLQGKTSGTVEVNLDQRIVRIQVSPILAENGRTSGAVIVCHDATELRRLEQMRTDFVANVSHELRTPLTSIKGFVETLMDGAAEVAEVRERFLKIIEEETLRLQRLIEDLLTLSNIENRENRDNRWGESISRQSFAQEAYKKIKPVIQAYADAKGILLEINLAENLPAIPIGEDLLSQVLLNLMENAVKYTSSGKVWLKGNCDKGHVYLEFGDTGCGIPEESLPRIFERFYRVDKARSREQGGTGLGLSIVKHIVEGCAGRITVRSKLDKGTVFTCQFPRAWH